MFRALVIITYFVVLPITKDISCDTGRVEVEGKQNKKYVMSNRIIEANKNLPLPKLSEEEENSMYVADHLTCPSCQAIVFQLHIAFALAHKYNNKRMTDAELLDITGKTK